MLSQSYKYMLRIILIVLTFLTLIPSLSAGEGFIVESIGKARFVEPRKRLVEQVL